MAELLGTVQDWEVFVKLINDHGIIALASYNIKEAGHGKLVPEKAMAIIENGLMQSVVRNSWLTERWKEVNTILNDAGIKHILLKGMALEYTIYGSKGLRQMTDNDILIKKEEAVCAWELLQNKGFKIGLLKSSLHRKIILETAQHLPALYKDGYALEIHTRLFDETKTDRKLYDGIFKDAPEIKIDNDKTFILPKGIHIKYLLKHFNRHLIAGECQIRTYTDIKLLDPENTMEFPGQFIPAPDQRYKTHFKRVIYRENIMVIPPRFRFRFIVGDLFPSVEWMNKRYRCSGIKTILYYPHRMGKLLWLV